MPQTESPLIAATQDDATEVDKKFKMFESNKPNQLTIFDKIVEKPGALISQQIEAANAQKIKIATAKVEKRVTRKKGKMKGITYTVTSKAVDDNLSPGLKPGLEERTAAELNSSKVEQQKEKLSVNNSVQHQPADSRSPAKESNSSRAI